jgi:hypothetical protein
MLSRAASLIEEVARAVAAAVPADWTGPTATSYRARAQRSGVELGALAEQTRLAAAAAHLLAQETAAVRAALAAGAPVAV